MNPKYSLWSGEDITIAATFTPAPKKIMHSPCLPHYSSGGNLYREAFLTGRLFFYCNIFDGIIIETVEDG